MFTKLTVLAHLKIPASKQKRIKTPALADAVISLRNTIKLHKNAADGSSDQNATCKAVREFVVKMTTFVH